MLYVFNRNEEVVAVLEQANKDACQYSGGNVKSVLNGEQVLTFRVPYHHDDAKKIEEHGYIARQNKYKQWQLFQVTELIEVHGEDIELEVTAEGAYVEMDNIPIEDMTFDRKTPAVVLPALLSGTRWEAGNITGTGIHDLTLKNSSLLEAISDFKARWLVEISYRIEIAGNRISRRIVDCDNVKGAWKGKRFEYTKDLVEVTRTVDAKNVKTALYGLGKEIDDSGGLRETFADVVWVKGVDGAPVDKPAGQTWVGDPTALATWGKPWKYNDTTKQHLFGRYETSENTDAEDLIWETWVELQKVNVPAVTYQVKVVDLFRILGIEAESVDLGDTVAVIDKDLNDLKIQARVIEYEEDLDFPDQDVLTIGNYIPNFVDRTNALQKTTDELAANQGGNYLEAGDTIDPSWIDTAFDFAKDAITVGNGTVIMNEGEGILIVDDPVNPQKAIKLAAGQIALANSRDIATNTFNWRNFGTGEGWLADLVTAGFIKFDRMQGGTLLLGGANNSNGRMVVYNATGDVVGDLDASRGGFVSVYVGDLRAGNVLNSNNVAYTIYVNPTSGSDNYTGASSGAAFKRLQTAIDSIPKHNNAQVNISVSNANFNEYEIHIEGFFGSGSIIINMNGGVLNGMLYIKQNSQYITVSNAILNQIYGTQYVGDGTISVRYTHFASFTNCNIYCRNNVDFGILARGSNVILDDCSFFDGTTACIHAEYGATIDIVGSCDGRSRAGLRAVASGRINVCNVTAPSGTVTNQELLYGGQVLGTVSSYQAGTPAPPAAPPLTKTFSAQTIRSWRSKTFSGDINGWRAAPNYDIYQGEWTDTTSYGNHKGCFWFDNTAILNTITGRTLKGSRIKLRRKKSSGYNDKLPLGLWCLTSASTVVQVSQPVVDYNAGELASARWGDEVWLEIPTWIVTALSNGSYRGFCLYQGDANPYVVMESEATLEITYV